MNQGTFEFYDSTIQPAMPFLIVLFFVIYGVIIILKELRLRYRSPDTTDSAVLFSYFSKGNDLIAADKHNLLGVEGGADIVTMVTVSRSLNSTTDAVAVDSGKAIQLIELPFRSRLHLLAISKGGGLDQLNPTIGTTAMSTARLEGDFGNYFSLYIDKGQDFELRYVLDPKAMAYVVDFCHKYHWEIINDVMYIVAKSAPARDNVIAEFIAQIRPAIETAENTPVKPKVNKVQSWPQQSKFKCPVCHHNMNEYRYWHECINGHGQLISGAKLTDTETKHEFLSKERTIHDKKQHQNLVCPACNNSMTAVDYASSNIIIDACTSCYYRWLDAGELKNILDRSKYF